MFVDRIDQLEPDELGRAVFEWLLYGTSDVATAAKVRDRRLIPTLVAVIEANGRPAFAPPEVTDEQAERATAAAAYLLGDIARPDDEAATGALIALLERDNSRLSLAAAVALGEIGVAAASEPVVAFMERMRAQGELGAVSRLTRVIARIGDAEALAYLRGVAGLEGLRAADKQTAYVMGEIERAIDEMSGRLG